MSDSFDPYYIWLGIPPKDQPPNHYRLLGIQELEENTDVIDAAANRQTTYLHEMAAGPHRKESQQLLNELAGARRCLLNPEQKRQYDAQLLAERASAEAAAVPVAQAVTSPVPLIDTGEIPGSELPDFDFSSGASPEVEPGTDTALAANFQPNQHAPQQKLPTKSGASDADAGEDGAVPGKPIPRQWIITGCSVVVVAIIAFIFFNGSDSARKKQPTSTSTRSDGSGGAVTSYGYSDTPPVTSEDGSGPADGGLNDKVDTLGETFRFPSVLTNNEEE